MFDVGILTWYKSLNHGAVLQAYASQKFLENHGLKCSLLDYNRNVNVMETKNEKIKRKLSYFNINHLKMKLKLNKWNKQKRVLFSNFIENNMNTGKMYFEYENIKNVMIGSDMVFDFYEGYNPFMYGKNVNSDNIFSYAACFGYTTEDYFEKFCKKNEIIELINKMSNIGYRDNNTYEILKNKCNISNATKNIDPVLLYGFDNEKKEWNSHGWEKENYVLIYSYQTNLNKRNEVNSIKKIARNNNLKIISVGYYHAWCDENINADPKEFVELFNNAKYVITDTFHGLVFSIIMSKQFTLFTRNNSFKVLDLLKDLNITYDINLSVEVRLNDMLKGKINYKEINSLLFNLRSQSENYLLHQLNKESK